MSQRNSGEEREDLENGSERRPSRQGRGTHDGLWAGNGPKARMEGQDRMLRGPGGLRTVINTPTRTPCLPAAWRGGYLSCAVWGMDGKRRPGFPHCSDWQLALPVHLPDFLLSHRCKPGNAMRVTKPFGVYVAVQSKSEPRGKRGRGP